MAKAKKKALQKYACKVCGSESIVDLSGLVYSEMVCCRTHMQKK